MGKKEDNVEFKCTICEQNNFYTKAKLVAHLDMEHTDVSNARKNEIVHNFEIELLSNVIGLRNVELKSLRNELNILNKNKTTAELEELKEAVLKSLQPSQIDLKSIEVIKSRKSIQKLKIYLSRGLHKKYRIYLDDAKIDFQISLNENKKKLKKHNRPKLKKAKDYFDSTTNSVRPIYNAMGNRR